MANARAANVIFVDTTAYTLDQKCKIRAVKYIGNASGTAAISVGTAGTGTVIWQEAGTNNLGVDEICARVDGFYVTLTNSAKVIIYLED
jgi:hypothetical protein